MLVTAKIALASWSTIGWAVTKPHQERSCLGFEWLSLGISALIPRSV